MEETIEQIFLKLLGQVSSGEKARNRSLERKTLRVLKMLQYLKAVAHINGNMKDDSGV